MERTKRYDRDAALDAAMMLFWEKGYHATSLKDLENALQMKPGSIYSAFTSKEALFSLALERYFQRNFGTFQSTLSESASPLQGLVDFMKSIVTTRVGPAQCRSCMLVKTLLTATASDEAIFDQAKGYLNLMEAEMAKAFQQSIDLGELPQGADAQHLARRYLADITSLRVEASRDVSNDDLGRSVEDLAQRLTALRQTSVV